MHMCASANFDPTVEVDRFMFSKHSNFEFEENTLLGRILFIFLGFDWISDSHLDGYFLQCVNFTNVHQHVGLVFSASLL